MKYAFTILIGIGTIIVLLSLGNKAIQNGNVPPLDQFMASTTQGVGTVTSLIEHAETLSTTTSNNQRILSAPKGIIYVTIADTDALREHGLSDRASLGDDQGMLFTFPIAQMPGFWMKDMHFPLDMVWIDASSTVVGVTENISPATYPNVFYPPSLVTEILEINAGAAQKFGIATGTVLGF